MHAALIEIGAVILGLGLLGAVSLRFSISPIPLYLLAGLAFGHGGLLPLETSAQFTETGAEIGVILLLFSLGLEYTAAELVTTLRHNAPAGLVDLVLNALPGVAVALLLGWGPVAAVALGGITYVTSSGITAKVLSDLNWLGNREVPVVLSLLVFEDLTMAVYLPILTAMLAGAGFVAGLATLGIAAATITVILIVALRFGRYVEKFVDSPVFFVFFGLQTDPRALPPVAGIAVLLAVAGVGTKLATGWWAARRAGVGSAGRLRAGVVLVSRGEFTIVIAGLAVAAGVRAELGPLAAAYVLVLAVVGPLAARVANPVVRRIAERRRSKGPAPVAVPQQMPAEEVSRTVPEP